MLVSVSGLSAECQQTSPWQKHVALLTGAGSVPELHDNVREQTQRVDALPESRVGVEVRWNALARLIEVHCDLVWFRL